ncbi:immunoglobulin domain-containing protein [Belliella pelovolcani]|uniref:Ig-like domain-containing protein n=1 Tax=Belliella pelovolcani TaxID=529505 RepID=A0A1N7KGG2_9BACT|nr:hypothetical protein [Belliella pelovolcani]SIS60688.1 hypothetical protein SAMN05421761_10258 [Belliella pelovolcani]
MKLNPTVRWSTGVLALAIFLIGCQEMESLDANLLDKSELALSDGAGDHINARMMIQNVEPVVITGANPGGNVECSEVADHFELDGFNSSSERIATASGSFNGTFPAGFTVTLTSEKTMDWSFTPGQDKCLFDIAVIVKGGPSANVYYYKDGQTGGTGLVAPGGAGISNVTFCYNITEAPAAPEVMGDEACYEEGIKLTAKAVNVPDGVTIVWYESAEGGSPVADPSITTVGSKTYYAEAVSGTCVSTSRSAATLEIWDLPAAPTNPNSQERCIETYPSLTASVEVPEGVTVIWYDEEGNETDYITVTTVGTHKFYAEPISENGCVGERTEVVLILKVCGDTDIEEDPCYADETAWASRGAGLDRYNSRGNWATWVYFNGNKTVDLFAGQTHLIGTVSFADNGNNTVTITIELNSDGAFQDVGDNVKIQDYASKPSGNPAPGGFAHKGTAEGSSFEITVPKNNYYGVHVDAARLIECPVDED